MYYYCKNCDDDRFILQNGIFNMCRGATDHIVFSVKFPITEQFH